MADLGDGRVVLSGGYDGHHFLADAWLFGIGGWTPFPLLESYRSREHHRMVARGPGQILLFGGDYSRFVFADLWLFDSSGFHLLKENALGRSDAAMAYDSKRQRTVLFGGRKTRDFGYGWDGIYLNDTWEYDGIAWTPGKAAPKALKPRASHAMAYNPGRGVVMLFGGYAGKGTYLSDTWEYDGTAWRQGAPAPPTLVPRGGHALAYDSARRRLVLFGGRNAGGYLDDTWELASSGWTQGPAAPTSLSPRADHAMAYDAIRRNIVLFGGDIGYYAPLDDTWTYDGTAWTSMPQAPASLLPRKGHAMTFDPDNGFVVLNGGTVFQIYNGSVELNDTWLWDGSSFHLGPDSPAGLTLRTGHTLTYDARNHELVLTGGTDRQQDLGDTWVMRVSDPIHYLAGTGAGPKTAPRIAAFDSLGAKTMEAVPYGSTGYGTEVAGGLVLSRSTGTILAGPGPGPALGPQVRGFDASGGGIASINFFAYGTLRFGVRVAACDLDGDGIDAVITGAGAGQPFGPQVRGWRATGTTTTPLGWVNFFAYQTLQYGVNASSGDLDASGLAEILTGPGRGPWFHAHVRAFQNQASRIVPLASVTFSAYPGPTYGARVTGGDVDGDGIDEIAVAPGPGPAMPSRHKGFDVDRGVSALPGYDIIGTPGSLYGGRLAVAYLLNSGGADLVGATGPDPAQPSTVRTFVYDGSYLTPSPLAFDAFPGPAYGANVALASLAP